MQNREYSGPDRRRGPLLQQCEDCVTMSNDVAVLKSNYQQIMTQMSDLTGTLKQTNSTLSDVVVQLAEQRGARKMGVAIATLTGSVGGFIAELGLDKVFHR